MASEEEWGRRVLAANAEGMRWTCEQAGHPNQLPDDVTCICGTWAHHIEAGAVVVGCGGRPGNEPGSYVREASDG